MRVSKRTVRLIRWGGVGGQLVKVSPKGTLTIGGVASDDRQSWGEFSERGFLGIDFVEKARRV